MLEMCAPLWTGALTQKRTQFLAEALERVQQNFCKILFPFKSYSFAKRELQIQDLSERRILLSKRCATKMEKNPKFSHLFPKIKHTKRTRSGKIYQEPKWKSNRYGFSSIPFFIRILNGEIPNPVHT